MANPKKTLSAASKNMPTTKNQTEIERQPRKAAISATAPPQAAPAYASMTMTDVLIWFSSFAASWQEIPKNCALGLYYKPEHDRLSMQMHCPTHP